MFQNFTFELANIPAHGYNIRHRKEVIKLVNFLYDLALTSFGVVFAWFFNELMQKVKEKASHRTDKNDKEA